MDLLEFSIKIIQSLSWPISIIIVIIIFRNPIINLISGISRFKYQGIEIDFDKKLDRIDKKICCENISNIKEITERVYNSDDYIETIANTLPCSAIELAWELVEKELEKTIVRLGIIPQNSYSKLALKNINLLKENKLIDKNTEEVLYELRIVRNQIIYNQLKDSIITSINALKYYEITKKTIAILKSIEKN